MRRAIWKKDSGSRSIILVTSLGGKSRNIVSPAFRLERPDPSLWLLTVREGWNDSVLLSRSYSAADRTAQPKRIPSGVSPPSKRKIHMVGQLSSGRPTGAPSHPIPFTGRPNSRADGSKCFAISSRRTPASARRFARADPMHDSKEVWKVRTEKMLYTKFDLRAVFTPRSNESDVQPK